MQRPAGPAVTHFDGCWRWHHQCAVKLLDELASRPPIAWGCPSTESVLDVISPEEHAEHEGDYTLPLYTQPVLP